MRIQKFEKRRFGKGDLVSISRNRKFKIKTYFLTDPFLFFTQKHTVADAIMRPYASRGCLIAVEGSPNIASDKIALIESYLDIRSLPYITFFFQEEDALGQLVYDIDNSMFTRFTPESQFLIQCADFYQHAQKIEEYLRKGFVVIITKYLRHAISTAQVRYVSETLFEAVKDLPFPDHTFVCDFTPAKEYEKVPFYYSRTLTFIESYQRFITLERTTDCTIVPENESNDEFLVKVSHVLKEFY